jgi:hypothetical protein
MTSRFSYGVGLRYGRSCGYYREAMANNHFTHEVTDDKEKL